METIQISPCLLFKLFLLKQLHSYRKITKIAQKQQHTFYPHTLPVNILSHSLSHICVCMHIYTYLYIYNI